MANNKIQVKRTNVSGRTPNTTNSSNSQYISAGELALNMTDGILFTSNGSSLIEVGANNTSQNISTNNLTVGNTLFVVANGNVGIGTASPGYKLDLDGAERISTTAGQPLLLYKYGSAAPTIGMFAANGTKDSPTQTLTGDVIGGITMFGYGPTGFAGGPSIRIRGIAAENNGTTSARGTDLTFETVNLGGVTAQERLRITANGDIGIGISLPTAKLSVANSVSPTSQHLYGTYTDGSNYERINFTANSTGHYILGEEAGTGSARNLLFGANNTTLMTVAANGNVGVGTTSPISKFHIVHTSPSSTNGLRISDTGGVNGGITLGRNGNDGYFEILGQNDVYGLRFRTNGTSTDRFAVDISGNVSSTGTYSTSSGRLINGLSTAFYVSADIPYDAGIQFRNGSNGSKSAIQPSNGALLFYTNANNTNFDNSMVRMFIANSGNVGIGTSSPVTKLHLLDPSSTALTLQGATWSSNPTIWFGDDSAHNMGRITYVNNGDYLVMGANGETNVFAVTSGAKVGIGSISPTGRLQIKSNSDSYLNVLVLDNDGNRYTGMQYHNSGVWKAGSYYDNTTAYMVQNTVGGYLFFANNGVEAVRINTNGQVGIGINPNVKLAVSSGTSPTTQHIYGTYTDISNYERINFTANSTGHYILGEEAGTGAARPIYFGANNSARVILDEAGRMGIGSTAAISGEVALQVVRGGVRWTFNEDTKSLYYQYNIGTTPLEGWSIGAPGFGALPFYLKFDRGNVGIGTDGDAGTNSLVFQTQSTTRMSIAANGNVGIGTITPSQKLEISSSVTNNGGENTLRISNPASSVSSRVDLVAGNIDNEKPYFAIKTRENGAPYAQIERVRIDASGNIGIGNTAPAHKLRVEGTVSIAGNTTPSANLTYDLGSPTLYWNNVYSNNIVTNSASFSSNVSVGNTLSVSNNIVVNRNLDITSKNVAGLTTIDPTVLTSFPVGDYRGGRFTILARRGNETHMSEVMVTHNVESAFYNEYSVVYSNTSLFNVSADISGSNVRILATSSTLTDLQFQILENKFAVDLDVYDRAGTLLLDRSGSVIDERRITREVSFGLDFINNSYGLVT